MKKIALIFLALLTSVFVGAQEIPHVPGNLLVRITEDAKIQDVVDDFRQEMGWSSLKAASCLNEHMCYWLLEFDEDLIDDEYLKGLMKSDQRVLRVMDNHIMYTRETVPNDELFGDQWHHVEDGDHDIDSDLAWDITTGGETMFGDEIVVCVIEGGGSDYEHEDLLANHWTNDQELDNGIDDDGNGYIDDINGWNPVAGNDNIPGGNHGTSVSSMIGSKGNDEVGVAGVNWDVGIMQVTVGSLTSANVTAAYAYPLKMRMMYNEFGGAKGAFVVATNASWGIDGGDPDAYQWWCEYYDTLGTHGVLNCGATANQNWDIDVVGDLPTGCGSDYMISVTATNDNDVRTFSGYGETTIDLAAPGQSVFLADNGGYGTHTGTSFASPCVAGAIGLLYSAPCPSFISIALADPQLGADMAREYIFNGVDLIDNLEGECVTGGRLNVHNSLNLILEECSEDGCLQPFGVAVVDGENGDVDVSWGSIDGMESFDIRYRVVGTDTWTTIEEYEGNEFSIAGADWCTEYEIQLASNCPDSEETESAWSSSYIHLTDGCCTAPDFEAFAALDVTDESIEIAWEDLLAGESYTVEYRIQGESWMTIDDVEATSYLFDGLDICTFYEFRIATNCADDETGFSEVFTVRTTGCGACVDIQYCEISSDNASEEWIDSFQLGDFTNDSGNNDGYVAFTDDGINLGPGATYDVTLTPGFDGGPYNEYWRIWIDFDSSGDFSPEEIVFDSGDGSEEEVTGQVTIPEDAEGDGMKMRVVMKYVGNFGTPPGPCADIAYGEIEDYCVNIQDIFSVGDVNRVHLRVFPNPAEDLISFNGTDRIDEIRVFDSAGRMVALEAPSGQRANIDLSSWNSGFYMYSVLMEDGRTKQGTFIKQ